MTKQIIGIISTDHTISFQFFSLGHRPRRCDGGRWFNGWPNSRFIIISISIFANLLPQTKVVATPLVETAIFVIGALALLKKVKTLLKDVTFILSLRYFQDFIHCIKSLVSIAGEMELLLWFLLACNPNTFLPKALLRGLGQMWDW